MSFLTGIVCVDRAFFLFECRKVSGFASTTLHYLLKKTCATFSFN